MQAFIPYAGVVLLVLSLGLNLLALIKIGKIRKAHDQLFSGKQVSSLEKIILELVKKSDKLDRDIEDLFNASNQLNKLSSRGLTRIGVVRYNPYGEKGHKNCFAIALVDGKRRGIVFSTLTTEQGIKIFAKQVNNGKSDIPLMKEEERALNTAK
ncbi:MAG: DUF4446 family protein [Patescibacteria group bacterium]|nr:DUF4446 family protein [Patescibacteria group bacterium]